MKLAIIHGWGHARQFHNSVMQALEFGGHDWQDDLDHLSYFINNTNSSNTSGASSSNLQGEKSDSDSKIANIICRSYNLDRSDNGECAFSREGKVCSKIHMCLFCAKKGLCFKHPEKFCKRK